jgi:HEPN domain-containing protein
MAEAWSAVPEWLRKAEADWLAAESLHSQANAELCDVVVFHAQQCVEKLFKANLIALDQPVHKIHDLLVLSRELSQSDPTWRWEAEELSDLSDGAVLARYPGFDTEPEDASELLVIAAKLRTALLQRLE